MTNNRLIHDTILVLFQRSSSYYSPPPPPPPNFFLLFLQLFVFLVLLLFLLQLLFLLLLLLIFSFSSSSCVPSSLHLPPPPPLSSSFCTLQPFKFDLTTDVDSVQYKAPVLHLFYTHTPQVQLNIGEPINLRLTSPPSSQLSSNFLTVL